MKTKFFKTIMLIMISCVLIFGGYSTVFADEMPSAFAQDDVAHAFTDVADEHLHYLQLDLRATIRQAGLAEEQFINMLYAIYTHSMDADELVSFREDGLLRSSISAWASNVYHLHINNSMETARANIRAFWVYKETLEIIGSAQSLEFLAELLGPAGQTFDVDRMFAAMFNNPDYSELLRGYINEYGVYEFIWMVTEDFDVEIDLGGTSITGRMSRLHERIDQLIDYGELEGSLYYVDNLMGGLFSNNVSRLRSLGSNAYIRRSAIWFQIERLIDFEFLSQEISQPQRIAFFRNVVSPATAFTTFENIQMFPTDFEQRRTFDVNKSMRYVLLVQEGYRLERLNVFYENNMNEPLLLWLEVLDEDLVTIYSEVYEIEADSNFITQIIATEAVWYIEIWILNPSSAEQNGTLALRWTGYPLGHPSHRP